MPTIRSSRAIPNTSAPTAFIRRVPATSASPASLSTPYTSMFRRLFHSRAADPSGQAGLAVESANLWKTYGFGSNRVDALRGIDLRIEHGELVAIAGPSGCGKTTLLNCLAGLESDFRGDVTLAGISLRNLSDDQRAGLRGAETRRRALEMLSAVGLSDRLDHRPSALSGGQQQRVAIARALVNRPAIVWADEPTGNLDTDASGEIMALIRRLNHENGQTFVIVTHAPEVAATARRLIRMHDGQIVADGPVSAGSLRGWNGEPDLERVG